jgi:hypothetical protein
MFPDLFAAIGTTYGSGDGSTTFNVPDYNTAQRFAQGSTVAGTVKQAGLPNIEGSVGPSSSTSTSDQILSDAGLADTVSDGALSFGVSGRSVKGMAEASSTSKAYVDMLNFNASDSNPIYGASDTVQPKSLTVRFIIKAFDGQTPDSALIDITQYAQELAGKANITGSNLVHHRDEITTSGTYTAPVTGLYKITVKGGGGGGQGGGIQSSYYYGGQGGSEGGTTIAYERLKIGDTVAVVVGAGGAGGAKSTTSGGAAGSAGGNSTVEINSVTYIGGGGSGGSIDNSPGGAGTIVGASGTRGTRGVTVSQFGGTGGGAGGGTSAAGSKGGGGSGGSVHVPGTVTASDGFVGGDGFVTFEYMAPV